MSTCSTASAQVGEPTIGSAPTATAWVCLEQSGPWGPKAFTSSHLDADLGKAFEAAASAAGVRPQLIRSPGRHPASSSSVRTVLIACTVPGQSWLLQGRIENSERLLTLDFASIAAGVRPDWSELSEVHLPVLLVCAHSRRDRCCATLGREVAQRTAAAYPGQVWEASHLSGHRFAATTALLPSGHLHGRVLDGSVILEAAARGELTVPGWRGRSTWSRAGQAAEWAVRSQEHIWTLDGVTVAAEADRWRVTTRHQSWLVSVLEYIDGEAPASCGKVPEPTRRFTVTIQ